MVGDDDTQTLTNKDLSSTTNTFPNELNPVGAILMWGTASAPTGWLLCDGTAVSRTTYADLFAVLGTTYGAGNGTTTFNLPNLKGRVVVGKDAAQTEFDTLGETGGAKTHTLSTAELPSHTHTINHGHSASSGTESADHAHSGTTGGGGSHAHNIPNSGSFYKDNVVNSPSAWTDSAGDHSTDAAGDHAHSFSTGGRSAAHTHGITVNDFNGSSGSAGSGSAHNNLQPYIVLNYIIKA